MHESIALYFGLAAYPERLNFTFTFMHLLLQMLLSKATHIAFKIPIFISFVLPGNQTYDLDVVFLDMFLIANKGSYICSSLCVVKRN